MVNVTINGRKLQAKEGQTILEVARDNNIYIPTLCHNEGIEAYGGCRLCLVEILHGSRKRLVTACLYPVDEDLIVDTKSERVIRDRKMVMELLLARCPNNAAVKAMAGKMGVDKSRFQPSDKDCILCGMCVRTCQEIVGASAISLVDRGVNRKVSTPFAEWSDACIGCGSCAYVCPTDAIKFEDIGDIRYIQWPGAKQQFKLKKCKACGANFMPERQAKFMCEKAGLPADAFDKCPDCRD